MLQNTLENKVALVTGGTSGIGRASAIALAKAGAKVVVSGRREKEGKATVDLIRQAGGSALFVQADVTSEESVISLVKKTVDAYGNLDIAFNNAGVISEGPLTEASVKDYQHIFEINVKGVFLSMKHEIPIMLKNGGGSIINTSSIFGAVGKQNLELYVASKHAVSGLTRSAALSYAKQNIRINAVAPGGIDTDMFNTPTGERDLEAMKYFATLHPMGRIGTPEEIAAVVVFLASPAASFITGQSLLADGGYTAQ